VDVKPEKQGNSEIFSKASLSFLLMSFFFIDVDV